MQKLLLPIRQMVITAGYQNPAYRNKFGFSHYGQDSISQIGERTIFASGEGQVLALGQDSILGNVLIVLYADAFNSSTGKSCDLVIRYFHLKSISVRVGDVVTQGRVLGFYGNTGKYSAGAHLHLEVDRDTKSFAYSATVSKSGSIIKAGTSKTMGNPASVLFIGSTQSLIVSKSSFKGEAFVRGQDLMAAL